MKFPAGWQLSRKGIHYRVIEGNRCEGDRIMEFRTDGWVRPEIAHTLIMTDFKYHVEENNYGSGKEGSPAGKITTGSGWHYLKWALIDCFKAGWETIAARIERQMKDAARRRGQ